ncbi:MAG: VWA domain-containing protein [bacterium]
MQFTLLNALFLAAAGTAAIPLIITLLNIRKRRLIPFSSLWFVTPSTHKRMNRLKFYNIMLMIIRTLLVLFLVLAFARPVIKTIFQPAHNASEHVHRVLIIDNSLSMDFLISGRTLLDSVINMIQILISKGSPGDQWSVILANSPDEVLVHSTTDGQYILGRLREIRTACHKSDYNKSLQKAAALLEAGKIINKEIYIFSDFQKYAFKDFFKEPDVLSLLQKNINLFFVPSLSRQPANIAISGISFPGQIFSLEQPALIQSRFILSRAIADQEFTCRLFIDDRLIKKRIISPGGRLNISEDFTFKIRDRGFHTGRLEIDDDDFRHDNIRFFSFYIPEKIQVLIAGEEKNTAFLLTGLNPSKRRDYFIECNSIPFSKLIFTDLHKYQTLFLCNPKNISFTQQQRITEFIKQGGGCFTTLDENSDISMLNREFFNKFGITPVGNLRLSNAPAEFYSLKNIQLNHPIFTGLDGIETFPVRVYNYFPISGNKGLNQLIKLNNNNPLLVEPAKFKGKFLLFLSSLTDPEWTTMPYTGWMVVFLTRSAQYLAQNKNIGQSFTAGESINSAFLKQFTGGKIEVINPDNSFESIYEGTYTSPDKSAITLNQTGIYRINQNNKLLTLLTVNIDPRECSTDYYAKENISYLENYFSHTVWLEDVNIPSGLRYGKEIGRYMVYCIFLLIFLEFIILYKKKLYA